MAMMDASPVFVDTNVLVYANLAKSPLNQQAVGCLQALENRGVPLWISRQVLREYLAAMTRRDALTGAIPIIALLDDVRYFAKSFFVAEDGSPVTEHLLRILEEIAVGGRQVHDANIVATMLAYGVHRLLTHNGADFSRYSRWKEVLSLEADG